MIKHNIKLIYFVTILSLLKMSIFAEVIVDGTTKTAYFLDAPISGVQYKCDNGESLKTTLSDGSFNYDNTCANITFSLNDKVILGTIAVSKIPTDYKLYLTDFVGSTRIDTSNKYVRNLAVLLQSFDTDETPQNGISIISSGITTVQTINQYTTTTTLQNILTQQYPSRILVSELCAIVHLEEVLKDSGFYIDTVPPCKPKLAYDLLATSNDKTFIELIGERNSSIYLNGLDTGLKLDSDGRYYDFELNTTIQRDTFDDFNITYKDHHITPFTSDPLYLNIYNDTDQPYIDINNTISIASPSQIVSTFTVTDDSIIRDIPLSYEISGTHKDLFTISTSTIDYGTANLSFISPSTAGTYNITIKVIDQANHYDTADLTITVN